MTSTSTHPLHSRPTEELLAAGVTREQLTALREISRVVLGDSDRLFEVLGPPGSRGEAANMLAALHAIRSKRAQPLPGQQTEYAEKISAAINSPAVHRREEPTMETRTCTSCETEKPLDEFAKKGRGRSKTCQSCDSDASEDINRKAQVQEEGPAQSPPNAPEPDPPLSDANGWSVFTDPRLSQLTTLLDVLADALRIDTDQLTIEDAANLAVGIGEAFRPKAEAPK